MWCRLHRTMPWEGILKSQFPDPTSGTQSQLWKGTTQEAAVPRKSEQRWVKTRLGSLGTGGGTSCCELAWAPPSFLPPPHCAPCWAPCWVTVNAPFSVCILLGTMVGLSLGVAPGGQVVGSVRSSNWELAKTASKDEEALTDRPSQQCDHTGNDSNKGHVASNSAICSSPPPSSPRPPPEPVRPRSSAGGASVLNPF